MHTRPGRTCHPLLPVPRLAAAFAIDSKSFLLFWRNFRLQGRSRLDEHVFVRAQPDRERSVDFERHWFVSGRRCAQYMQCCVHCVCCTCKVLPVIADAGASPGGRYSVPAGAVCRTQSTPKALKMIGCIACDKPPPARAT